MKIMALLTGLSLLALSVIVRAESTGNSSQQAHVHGLAELTLALEGNKLELRLQSPSANIVGFEHKASTAEHNRVIENAKAILESPQQLFFFSGTSCNLRGTAIDLSAVLSDSNDKHHDEHEAHHEHDDHKDDHHDEHDEHHEADGSIHSEITASYDYECQQGAKLKSLSVGFFDQFSGFEKLNVKWLTDNNQGAIELTVKSKTIRLR